MNVVMWCCVVWCGAETLSGVASGAVRLRARRRRREPSFGDTLDLLALSARRGAAPAEMVSRCVRHLPADAAQPLLPVEASLERGAAAERAFAIAEATGDSMLAVSFAALGDVARHGGSIADELSRLSADTRRLDSAEVSAAARRLSVWLTAPLVVCHLPAFVLVAVVPAVLAQAGAL